MSEGHVKRCEEHATPQGIYGTLMKIEAGHVKTFRDFLGPGR